MTLDPQKAGDIFGKHVRLATAINEWERLDGTVDDRSRSTPKKLVIIFRPPHGVPVKPFPLVFKGEQLTRDNTYLSPEDMDVFAENRDAVKRLRHRQVHEAKTNHTSAKQNVPQPKVKQSGLTRLLNKLPIIQSLLGTTINYGEARLSTEHQIAKILPSELPENYNQELSTAVVSDTSDDAPNESQGVIPDDDQPSPPKEKEGTPEKTNPANRSQVPDEGSHASSNARSTPDPEIEDVSNAPEHQESGQLVSGEPSLLTSSAVVEKYDNNDAAKESLEPPIEEMDQPSLQSEISMSSEEMGEPEITTSDVDHQAVDTLTDDPPNTENVQDTDNLSELSTLPMSENQQVPPVFEDRSDPQKQRKQAPTDDPSEVIASPGEDALSSIDKASSPPGQPSADRGDTVEPPITPAQDEIIGASDPSETLMILEENSEDTAAFVLSKEVSRKQDDKPFTPGKGSNTLAHQPAQTPNSVEEDSPVNQPFHKRPTSYNRNDFESLDPSEASDGIFSSTVITIKSSTDDVTGLQSEDAFLRPEELEQRPCKNDFILSNSILFSSSIANRSLDDTLLYNWHPLEQENGLITTQPGFPILEESPYHLGSSEYADEACLDERKNADPLHLQNPGDSLDFTINEL
ncbi:MAG: hypothetical protein AAGF93_14565 [Cyanobacteria bacterium P01_H01_bin.105]